MKLTVIWIILCIAILNLHAGVKIVTTTTVIYSLVKEIGGDKVSVDYICRGDQDPHFLEVLPSYMLKIRKADIMFETGLGLELWAQKLIDGSRNSDLIRVDLSANIDKKGLPTGKVDASQGDIHPYGNPHYWLDPENAKIMADQILNSLSIQDPGNSDAYLANYDLFIKQLETKIQFWKKQMEKVKNTQFIVYHDSWLYFADRFDIRIAGFIEPKPGIPPTPSHNVELIRLISANKIQTILMENFYSDSSPNQISEKTGIRVVKVPVYVFGIEGVNSYFDLLDYIISKISGEKS
jgi:zinc/manganese transport system substrate-binding protein